MRTEGWPRRQIERTRQLVVQAGGEPLVVPPAYVRRLQRHGQPLVNLLPRLARAGVECRTQRRVPPHETLECAAQHRDVDGRPGAPQRTEVVDRIGRVEFVLQPEWPLSLRERLLG